MNEGGMVDAEELRRSLVALKFKACTNHQDFSGYGALVDHERETFLPSRLPPSLIFWSVDVCDIYQFQSQSQNIHRNKLHSFFRWIPSS
jgi:hypothetical protein